MKDEKQANELETTIHEEARPVRLPSFAPVVNTATVRRVLPSLIKMAAVELARRDHEAKR